MNKKTIKKDGFVIRDNTLVKYVGNETDITVPNVEIIGNLCFDESPVRRIILPETVRILDEFAFSCSQLETIEMPGVTKISDAAFNCCRNLSSIHIPADVKVIGGSTFWECESLQEINLDSIISIGGSAFIDSGIRNVNLKKVQRIGMGAFRGCRNLTSVYLPETLKEIYSDAFADSSVKTVQCDNDNLAYTTVGESLILYDKREPHMIMLQERGTPFPIYL